jgi:hypothetical protein
MRVDLWLNFQERYFYLYPASPSDFKLANSTSHPFCGTGMILSSLALSIELFIVPALCGSALVDYPFSACPRFYLLNLGLGGVLLNILK